MNYMSRAWMATSVAVVNSHSSDQGQKLKSGLMSLKHGKKHFFSGGGDAADLRPLYGVINSEAGGFLGGGGGGGDDKRRQTDDSLRQVMYLNCWGQS